MWDWLQQHNGTISALASVATLFVWAIYLDFMLRSYRNANRPKILINFGAGAFDNANCLIANMSAQPIYMDSVVATLHADGRSYTTVLSEQDATLSEQRDYRSQSLQGPLKTGEFLNIGTFRSLVSRVAEEACPADRPVDLAGQAHRLDILVAGIFTGSDRLIAAERCFDLVGQGNRRRIRPRSFAAEQIRSGRRRRQIERFMVNRHRERTKPPPPCAGDDRRLAAAGGDMQRHAQKTSSGSR